MMELPREETHQPRKETQPPAEETPQPREETQPHTGETQQQQKRRPKKETLHTHTI